MKSRVNWIFTIMLMLSAAPSSYARSLKPPRWVRDRAKIQNPLEEAKAALQEHAVHLAIDSRDRGLSRDYEDCLVMVATGLAAYGTAKGGWIGTALGGGAAAAFGRMACRKSFP